ncbi:MAG TPA: VOC family protein [Actinomycetota bacterium]|nr:VOC family protein [Actinomycetota bacterium]
MTALRIDHVILGVRDLDAAGASLLGRFGLGSVPGGSHAAWGTGNRIVPLGRDYLEIMAVEDPEVASRSEFGRGLASAVAGGDRFVGWCLRTGDLDGVAERLGLPVEEGSRTRPDGTVLAWRLAGRNAATDDAWLPFFIEWRTEPHDHPGLGHAPHRVHPVGISSLEVGGDAARLREWLGDETVPIHVVEGPRGVRSVSVGTTTGDVVVRP